MTTVLVTGGCGFIGSHFVRMLSNFSGVRIVNLDKLTYAANPENLGDIAVPYYEFIRGDIAEQELVEDILRREKPWAVVNFAAESHVDRSIRDSSPFLQTNIKGVQVLLECVRKYPVERFLQISTDEVYGDREDKDPATEDSCLLPSSPYAASKAAADLLCLSYRRTYDLPIIITRSANNYGPHQFPEKFLPLVLRNALAGMKLPVYGDGGQIRDWLYVEDNCRALMMVLEKAEPGAIYNIGTGEERTNLSVVRTICTELAKQLRVDSRRFEQHIESVADRPGHDRRYVLNTAKVVREIGWTPSTSFAEGLERTVRWYVDHPQWVKGVTSGEYLNYYDAVYSRNWQNSSK